MHNLIFACNILTIVSLCFPEFKYIITCLVSSTKTIFTGHGGYFGCSKCMVEGDYLNGRMCFSDTNAKLRTDENFFLRENEEFHLEDSILESVPTGMISQVPLDYMHLCCLGVMKKLLLLWIKGPLNVRIPNLLVQKISRLMLEQSLNQPKEFQRRVRGLDCLANWKATEFRTFLIYVGPIVLKDILHESLYQHFMMFSIAIRILVDPSRYDSFNSIANTLLQSFVQNFEYMYDVSFISYNVHNLIHLAACCLMYGPADNFSAFPFETKLGQIKRLVKHGRKSLQQVVNRLTESMNFKLNTKPLTPYKLSKNVKNTESYSEVYYPQFTFNSTDKNKWFLTKNNHIVEFHSVSLAKTTKKPIILGRKLKTASDFFELPIKSSALNIYMSTGNEFDAMDFYTIENVKCKLFCLKMDENLVFMPMNKTV